MTEIQSLFSVPFYLEKLENAESLNKALRELFLAKAAEGDRYRNPEPFVDRNAAVFESNFRLFDWPQACVKQLATHCMKTLYQVIRELNGYNNATLQQLHYNVESWFHITKRGGFFGAHHHGMHSWSGVYCVKHDGDDPNSDSGRLTFLYPNPAANMYLDMANANLSPAFAPIAKKFRLEPGQLIIFPSWLMHEVLPFEGEGERITVAFNVRFQMPSVRPLNVPLG